LQALFALVMRILVLQLQRARYLTRPPRRRGGVARHLPQTRVPARGARPGQAGLDFHTRRGPLSAAWMTANWVRQRNC